MWSAPGGLSPSTRPLWAGSGGPGTWFTGILDEVRVYGRELAASEVVADMTVPVDGALPLIVTTHTPRADATGVTNTPITATFSGPADPATVTDATFTLRTSGGDLVPADVTFDAPARTATLTPEAPLSPLTDYVATVLAGSAGVHDTGGAELVSEATWTFRTGTGTNQLRLAWHFAEGSGPTVADASGNGNAGSLANGAAWDSGQYGSGVALDGVDDGVGTPAADSLDVSDAFTLEAWVHPTAATPTGKIIFRQGATTSPYGLMYSPTGKPRVQFATAAGVQTVSGPTTVTSHVWTHLAATYDGATARVYVNGVEAASASIAGDVIASTRPLWVGRIGTTAGMAGRVDNVRIYGRALSAAEVVTNMNDPGSSDTTLPDVVSTVPGNGATGVAPDANVSATFTESMNPLSIGWVTFELRDAGGALVNATVSYDEPTKTATLNPAASLAASTSFTVRLRGGTTGPRITDLAGNAMAADETWIFTTGASSGPTVTSVTVFPRGQSISVGAEQHFTATAHYSDGAISDVTASATWASSVEAVGSMAAGLFEAISAGTTEVTASFDSLQTSATVRVYEGEAIPPDPALVAPAINRTVATVLADTVTFLFEGENPIQRDVAAGAIERRRTSVLRGRITSRDGGAIPGVRVEVVDHMELGYTLSRLDGAFDLAVNGGGPLRVRAKKDGYLTVDRQLTPEWQQFEEVPAITMIPLDTQVTSLDLSAASTVVEARGSVVTDDDGTRRATLLFSPGTVATFVLPTGTVERTQIDVRATEYTVGPTGPSAMPAPLPPTSGYTYAVEYSIDEARALGATEIRFDQPVSAYLENFLNIPIGEPVPVGYYDAAKGSWVAVPDGRVVKILSETGGRADLDLDGSNTAANEAALASLGITPGERERLATLYDAGQSLWRVQITHFSPYDCNYPRRPQANEYPRGGPHRSGDRDRLRDCDEKCGSVIEAQSQTLGESIPIAGAPFALHYHSGRVTGRKKAYTMSGPLDNGTLPGGLKRIEVLFQVGGQRIRQVYPAVVGQTYEHVWDGLDAYGRPVQGAVPAMIQIDYVYDANYTAPADSGGGGSFGQTGDEAYVLTTARDEYSLGVVHPVMVGAWHHADAGAGWALGVHHGYEPLSRSLQLGDGRFRRALAIGDLSVTSVAGSAGGVPPATGVPARSAFFDPPSSLAAGADGSLYLTETSGTHRIRPDGILETLAPASLGDVTAIGPDDSLYLTDTFKEVVRRRAPDGTITIIAGMLDQSGFSGDGGPATAARLNRPCDAQVAPDGTLYIADADNARIRRVGTDGIITTIAGTGAYAHGGDGGPAREATFNNPCSLALGPDGSVYVADFSEARVRRIGVDGVITTVAGTGEFGWAGDGGPAEEAQLGSPWRISLSQDGALYITDFDSDIIRRVDAEGLITTIGGNGESGVGVDGGAATRQPLGAPGGVVASPDGSVYVAAWGTGANSARVRAIAPSLPGLSAGDMIVPSEDGAEVYIFSQVGRHLRTLHGLTGAVLFEFEYDADGHLTQVTDGYGLVTAVTRTGAVATAIVAPGGQRTELEVDAEDQLTTVSNPAQHTWEMVYQDDWLLTSFRRPNGGEYTMTYDADGLLTRDDDPEGGSQTVAVTEADRSATTTVTSGGGRQERYVVEHLANGDIRRENTAADGTVSTTVQEFDGDRRVDMPDGTALTLERGDDTRWGELASFVTGATIELPSGLTSTLSVTRDVELSDPGNPLSLDRQFEFFTINGQTFERNYDRALNQIDFYTPQGRQTTNRLDDQGRTIEWKAGVLESVLFGYDGRGRLTTMTQGGRHSSIAYDDKDRPTVLTDALARQVSFTYDSADRITSQTLPNGKVIGFQYDANGNVTVLTPPGRPGHGFGYSLVDSATSYAPPAASGGGNTQYQYNGDRQLTRIVRPDTQETVFSYGVGNGRLENVTFSRGALGYTYDAAGRLSQLADPGGIDLEFSYDGFLPVGDTWSGSLTGSVTRTFNADLLLAEERVNGTHDVAFEYDQDGLLVGAGALELTRDQDNGLVTNADLGQTNELTAYSAFGEPERTTARIPCELEEVGCEFGLKIAFDVLFTRDDLGRITQRTELIDGVTRVWGYGYDLAGRLATVARNGVLISVYTYDDNGNREQRDSEQGVETGAYDEQDRLTEYSGADYTYTASGELATKTVAGQTTAFTYDTLGSLVQVIEPDGTVIAYEVDGRGRRVAKRINGVRQKGWLYGDQLRIVAELDGVGNVVSRFVYGSKANVPDYMMRNNVTYRIISDHLGSPRIVLNAADGVVAQRLDFDEFGRVVQDSSPGFQPFGFAGGLYDTDTGLVRFGARDYDPQIGRWTAKDPILFEGDDPNLFAYAQMDPVNFFDPSGLRSCVVDCAAKTFGIRDLIGAGLVAAGQPIPGTKPFTTPGSSRGTSAAGKAASRVFGDAKLPFRVPTLVGGPGTGRALAVAGTKSVARAVSRAVPFVGWGILAYDAFNFGKCVADCRKDEKCQ